MTSNTTVVIENGVATVTSRGITIVLSQGTVTIDSGRCCCKTEDPELVCEAQTVWGGDPVRFGFKPAAGGSDGEVKFFPPAGIGEATTDMPESIWVLQNQEGGVFVNLTRSPHLSSARSATVRIETAGEDPIELEVVPSGSGMAGLASGASLVAGKAYCVTITPAWGE